MPARNDSVPGNGSASTDVTLLQPALDFPLGCHSGLYTGTQNDTARCVVVALELPQNNVRGDLDGVLDTLLWLQTIDVSDNRLGGPLPSPNQPGRVFDMRFAGNRFHYEEFDVGRVVNLCRISARCTGMPPISCQAFGKNYELMITDSNQCVGCPSVLSTTVFYGAVLSGLVIIGIVIVILMIRDPEHMDEWISTIFIFVGHTQTLTIIGLLRLAWPVSAEKVTSSMGLDLANLGGSKPECFLQALTEEQRELLEEYGGSTFVTTMGRMIVVAFLLVGVTVTQSTIKRCAAWRGVGRGEALNDKLEFIETVVFSMQVVVSVRASVQLITQIDEVGWIGVVGAWAAVGCCAMQLLFIGKYALSMRQLLLKRAAEGQTRGNLFRAPSFLHDPRNNMNGLPSFLRGRGRVGTPVRQAGNAGSAGPRPGLRRHMTGRWVDRQAAVQGRREDSTCARLGKQWDAFTDWLDGRMGWSPGGRKLPLVRLKARLIFMTERFRDEAPYWQFALWGRQSGLVLAVSITEMRKGDLSTPTVSVASGVSILVLAASVVVHNLAQPYVFPYQNQLEMYLLLSSILVIILGFIYTFFTKQSDFVEYLLVAVLIGSLALGALYFWVMRKEQRPGGLPAKQKRRSVLGTRKKTSLGAGVGNGTSGPSFHVSDRPGLSTIRSDESQNDLSRNTELSQVSSVGMPVGVDGERSTTSSAPESSSRSSRQPERRIAEDDGGCMALDFATDLEDHAIGAGKNSKASRVRAVRDRLASPRSTTQIATQISAGASTGTKRRLLRIMLRRPQTEQSQGCSSRLSSIGTRGSERLSSSESQLRDSISSVSSRSSMSSASSRSSCHAAGDGSGCTTLDLAADLEDHAVGAIKRSKASRVGAVLRDRLASPRSTCKSTGTKRRVLRIMLRRPQTWEPNGGSSKLPSRINTRSRAFSESERQRSLSNAMNSRLDQLTAGAAFDDGLSRSSCAAAYLSEGGFFPGLHGNGGLMREQRSGASPLPSRRKSLGDQGAFHGSLKSTSLDSGFFTTEQTPGEPAQSYPSSPQRKTSQSSSGGSVPPSQSARRSSQLGSRHLSLEAQGAGHGSLKSTSLDGGFYTIEESPRGEPGQSCPSSPQRKTNSSSRGGMPPSPSARRSSQLGSRQAEDQSAMHGALKSTTLDGGFFGAAGSAEDPPLLRVSRESFGSVGADHHPPDAPPLLRVASESSGSVSSPSTSARKSSQTFLDGLQGGRQAEFYDFFGADVCDASSYRSPMSPPRIESMIESQRSSSHTSSRASRASSRASSGLLTSARRMCSRRSSSPAALPPSANTFELSETNRRSRAAHELSDETPHVLSLNRRRMSGEL